MRQLTFPSDITWQKSMCLTASLNSSTITSTTRQVSEGWCWPGKLLFYHTARWPFWMKEGSQALCPYNEMLNGITFSSTYPGTWMAGKWPSGAGFQHYIFFMVLPRMMWPTQMPLCHTTEPFHSWESVGVCHRCQTKLSVWDTLQGCLAPEMICIPGPWFDTKLGTWPRSISRHGSHQSHLDSYGPGVPRETLGVKNTLQIKRVTWNFIKLNRHSQLTFADRVKAGNELKLLRTGFLLAGRKSQSE